MRSHFAETVEIRKAIVDGSVAATLKPAQALSNTEDLGKVQGSWKPALGALRKAAQRLGQSADVPSAAAALADVGVACGRCHRAAGGPKPDVPPAPASDKSIAAQMKRHAWALERLWEGLYVPSDPAWKAGADALSAEPFPKEVLSKGGVHARSSAASFSSLVSTASTKQRADERAKLYAGLLETCSSCHLATRGKK